MGGKRIWIPAIFAIALLVIAGGIWWSRGHDAAPAKSDCDIAKELMDFKAASVKEQDTLLQAGKDEQRLASYKGSVSKEQQYVDQIQDPTIRGKAQAYVDADRESMTYQTYLFDNPVDPSPDGGPLNPQAKEAHEKASEIIKKFKAAKDQLLQACPAASSDPKL